MNGFKIFFYLVVACVIIGFIMAKVPACKPPDMGNCDWNSTTNRYTCPEDK